MSLISITLECPTLKTLYQHLQQTLNRDTPETAELRRNTLIQLRYWIEWQWFGEEVLEPFGSDLSYYAEESLDDVTRHFLSQITEELESLLTSETLETLVAIVPVSVQGTLMVFLNNDEWS